MHNRKTISETRQWTLESTPVGEASHQEWCKFYSNVPPATAEARGAMLDSSFLKKRVEGVTPYLVCRGRLAIVRHSACQSVFKLVFSFKFRDVQKIFYKWEFSSSATIIRYQQTCDDLLTLRQKKHTPALSEANIQSGAWNVIPFYHPIKIVKS